MFEYFFYGKIDAPRILLTILGMLYITMVILSIILFQQILKFQLLGFSIILSGAVLPYVFLYPISFIILRIYGFKQINDIIAAMILVSFIFVLMSNIVISISTNITAL